MSGVLAPGAQQALRDNRDEIRRAIDAVCFGAPGAMTPVTRNPNGTSQRFDGAGPKLTGGWEWGNRRRSRASESVIVPVRGHVPEAFLHWLRRYRAQIAHEARVLERCDLDEDLR